MISEYKNILKIGIVIMKNSKEVSQKIKNRTTIFLCVYVKKWNHYIEEALPCCYSIINNSQDIETAQVTTERLMDKRKRDAHIQQNINQS